MFYYALKCNLIYECMCDHLSFNTANKHHERLFTYLYQYANTSICYFIQTSHRRLLYFANNLSQYVHNLSLTRDTINTFSIRNSSRNVRRQTLTTTSVRSKLYVILCIVYWKDNVITRQRHKCMNEERDDRCPLTF